MCSSEMRDRLYHNNTQKYGTYHTLGTEKVKSARERVFMNKYGVTNPFYSREFQNEQAAYQRLPETRKRMSDIIKSKFSDFDWGARNEKMKSTVIAKYGVTCSMNTPEQIQKRRDEWAKYGVQCPYGCSDGTIYHSHQFQTHCWQIHNVHKRTAKAYYNATIKKDKDQGLETGDAHKEF